MTRRRASQRLIQPVRSFRAAIVMAAFMMVTTAVAGTSVYRSYFSHAAGGWLSGSSGEETANGNFGNWRGEPDLIAGTWTLGALNSGAEYGSWGGDLDLGVGGMVGSWGNSASGGADSQWDSEFSVVRDWLSRHPGHTVFVRFAYEFNGNWMDWSVGSGDIQNFITAFRRWADKCHAISGCKTVWAANDGTSQSYDVRTTYPGSQWVDVVGVDSYNQYPWAGSASEVTAKFNSTNGDGSPLGIEAWRKYALSVGKPVAVPEWANCNGSNCAGGGGDSPAFIQGFHDWAAANAGTGPGNVWYEIFFNVASFGTQFEIYPDDHGATQSANMYVSLNWGNGGVSGAGGGGGGGGSTPTPVPTSVPQPGSEVQAAGNLLAGKAFSSSVGDSTSEAGHPVSYLTDGNGATRWISQPTSPVTLTADMGASYTLNKVSIKWAGDTVNHFQIQTSPDNTTWTTVVTDHTNNTSPEYHDYTQFSATPTGRYFRIVGTDRWNSSYGNSIWEVGAYGTSAADRTPPSVQLTAPAANAAVKGSVSVTGTASDNVGVTRVDLLVDGAVRATNTSSSANFSWSSTTVADGNHTLALKATDAAGNAATTPAITVAVNNAGPVPAPTIQAFSAIPASIVAGGHTTLYWSTQAVSACSVNPGGPQLTTGTSWGTPSLETAGTMTYTLDCLNGAGTHVSKTAAVTVTNAAVAPSKPTLVASNLVVTSGSSVTLSWYGAGATSCTLAPNNITSAGTSGSYVTKITATTTFGLTCRNNAGSASATPVTVSVGSGSVVQPSAPHIVSFFADPARIAAGLTSTLYWSTSGVPSGGCNLNPSPLNTTGPNGSWTTPYLLGSKSYTLTCVGTDGTVVSQGTSVVVNDITAPTSPSSVVPAVNSSNSTQTNLTATNGQTVVNGSVATSVAGLVTLDPSNITSSTKQQSITKVEYYEGQSLIQTDSVAPYVLDTTKLPNGTHTITERTYYTDGSRSEVTRVINIDNTKKAATTTISAGAIAGIVLTVLVLLGVVGGVLFVMMRNRVTISSLRSRYGNTIDTSLIDPGK